MSKRKFNKALEFAFAMATYFVTKTQIKYSSVNGTAATQTAIIQFSAVSNVCCIFEQRVRSLRV